MAHRLGEVTPEPTPTPALEGTWVLNERLYAPENTLDVNVSFTAYNDINSQKMFARIYNSSFLEFITANNTVSTIYNYSTNAWVTKYKYITFPAGATASDEFRAWLASNATKQ